MRVYTELFNYSYQTNALPWAKNSAGDLGSIVSNTLRLPYNSYANKATTGLYQFVPEENYRNNFAIEFDLNVSVASLNSVFNFMFYGHSGYGYYPAINKNGSGQIRLVGTMGYSFGITNTPGWSGWDGVIFTASTIKVRILAKRVSGTFHVAMHVYNGSTLYKTPWVETYTYTAESYLQMGCLNYSPTSNKTGSAYYSIPQINVYDELTDAEIDGLRETGVFSPSITPSSGNQFGTTEVSLSYGVEPGASIYYTTNGVDPTASDNLYTAPFIVGSPFTPGNQVTVKAIAIGAGDPSGIATAVYDYIVPEPSVTVPGGDKFESVNATVDKHGFQTFYTLNGVDPTSASTEVTGTSITVPYQVGTTTLKVVSYHPGTDSYSTIASVDVVFSVASATISHSGKFNNSISVTLACPSVGSIIEYTLNGGPTLTYSGPIALDWNDGDVVISAIGKVGSVYSLYGSTESSIEFIVGAPSIDPPESSIASDVTVTIGTETSGSVVYYTLDGSRPNSSSNLYVNPIAVPPGTLLQAVSFSGGKYSKISSALFDFEYNSTKPLMEKIPNVEGGYYTFYQKNQNYQLTYDLGTAETSGAVDIDSRIDSTLDWLCIPDFYRFQSSGNSNTEVGYKLKPTQYCYAESLSKSEFSRAITGAFAWEFCLQLDVDTLHLLTNEAVGYTEAFDADCHWTVGSYRQALNFRLFKDGAQQKLESTHLVHGANEIVELSDVPALVSGNRLYIKIELDNSILTFKLGIGDGSSSAPTAYVTYFTKTLTADVDWWLRSEIDTTACMQPEPLSNTYYGWKEWVFNYVWVKVTGSSSKWLKTASGITMSAKANLQVGPYVKNHVFHKPLNRTEWESYSYRCDGNDYSQNYLNGYNQYSSKLGGIVLRKMLVGGSSSDNKLQLRWYKFDGDFLVQTKSKILLSIYRNMDSSYAPVFKHSMLNNSSNVEVRYLAGAGVSSKVSVYVDGSEISGSITSVAGVELEDFETKFERISNSLTVQVKLQGIWQTLHTVSNSEALCPSYTVTGSSSAERASRSPMVIQEVSIDADSATCSQSTNEVLLHGCYFISGGSGHGWTSQSLTLPLGQSGKVVYSKLSRTVSIRASTYYLDQDVEVLVALFSCNQTGLDHFTVVLSGSLICKRGLVAGQLDAEEYVIGCGSSPYLQDGNINWSSNGFLETKRVSEVDFLVPTQAYRGFSNVRLVSAYEENNICMSFYKKEIA